jgi:hypothetical protein
MLRFIPSSALLPAFWQRRILSRPIFSLRQPLIMRKPPLTARRRQRGRGLRIRQDRRQVPGSVRMPPPLVFAGG